MGFSNLFNKVCYQLKEKLAINLRTTHPICLY